MRPKLLHHIIVAASARTLRHLGAVELPALLHRAFVFVVVSSFALKKVCLPHTSTLLRFSFGRRHIFPPLIIFGLVQVHKQLFRISTISLVHTSFTHSQLAYSLLSHCYSHAFPLYR